MVIAVLVLLLVFMVEVTFAFFCGGEDTIANSELSIRVAGDDCAREGRRERRRVEVEVEANRKGGNSCGSRVSIESRVRHSGGGRVCRCSSNFQYLPPHLGSLSREKSKTR